MMLSGFSDMSTFLAVKMSAYLMDTARDFRLKLKSAASFGNKKGQSATKPTHATVYVAKSYPVWQSTVIGVIKEFHDAGNVSDNKAISQVRTSSPFESEKFLRFLISAFNVFVC